MEKIEQMMLAMQQQQQSQLQLQQQVAAAGDGGIDLTREMSVSSMNMQHSPSQAWEPLPLIRELPYFPESSHSVPVCGYKRKGPLEQE
jgi:hypothetical protein